MAAAEELVAVAERAASSDASTAAAARPATGVQLQAQGRPVLATRNGLVRPAANAKQASDFWKTCRGADAAPAENVSSAGPVALAMRPNQQATVQPGTGPAHAAPVQRAQVLSVDELEALVPGLQVPLRRAPGPATAQAGGAAPAAAGGLPPDGDAALTAAVSPPQRAASRRQAKRTPADPRACAGLRVQQVSYTQQTYMPPPCGKTTEVMLNVQATGPKLDGIYSTGSGLLLLLPLLLLAAGHGAGRRGLPRSPVAGMPGKWWRRSPPPTLTLAARCCVLVWWSVGGGAGFSRGRRAFSESAGGTQQGR